MVTIKSKVSIKRIFNNDSRNPTKKIFNISLCLIFILLLFNIIFINNLFITTGLIRDQPLININDVHQDSIDIGEIINAGSDSFFANTYSSKNKLMATRSGTGHQELDIYTKYLIITPGDYLDIVQPLASWKTKKGVYTTVKVLNGSNGIYSVYTEGDNATKIHDFLIDYYNQTPNLKWLLLVGDSEIIPARKLLTNISTGQMPDDFINYCHSDYYYSTLDTTWDTDYDNVYGEAGEEDFVPELYVGRLPVSSKTEAKDSINKILVYEQNPPSGAWAKTAILCGGLMDRPNVEDDKETEYIDEGYNWYKDNSQEVIQKIEDILPEQINSTIYLDYSKRNYGEYTRENDTLNLTNVISAYNSGASVVNFVSHGTDNGVLHYNGYNGTAYTFDYYFNHDQAKKLINGYKLPLVYSSSCTSGNFTETDDSNLEGLITSKTDGAIGFIGATVDTYRLEYLENKKEYSYGNWWLNSEFWIRFYTGIGDFKPAEILYRLKEDYYKYYTSPNNPKYPDSTGTYQSLSRTNLFAYNLLGDPEVSIYTDSLKDLKVEFENNYSPVLRDTGIVMKVSDKSTNKPLQDAEICLINDNNYITNKTDHNGYAKFNPALINGETYNFTVTAHNYYYQDGQFTVMTNVDVQINNESVYLSRNPIPPGEIVNISVKIYNNGSTNITDLKLNCYSDKILPRNQITHDLIVSELPKGETKNLTFSWTPDPGSHDIIVYIDPLDDIFELDETNNIAVVTLIENIPPIFIANLPTKKIEEDTPSMNVLDLSKYVKDYDTAELEFSIQYSSYPDFNISINNSMLSLNPPPNWFGTVKTTIGVFDGTSIVTTNLTVIVDPINDPPIINDTTDWIIAGENITVRSNYLSVAEDQLVNITVVGYDIDDNASKLQYKAIPDLISINSTTGNFIFISENSDVGIYEINFTINDTNEQNNLAWRVVTLEVVNTNDPPELLISKSVLEAKVGELFEYDVIGYDVDENDTIKFSDATTLFDIDPDNGQIRFKPKDSQIGKHRIVITVTDGNLTSSKVLQLEIKSKPDEPLEGNYILICPIILVILILIFLIQEHLHHKSLPKSEPNSKDNPKKSVNGSSKSNSKGSQKDKIDKDSNSMDVSKE